VKQVSESSPDGATEDPTEMIKSMTGTVEILGTMSDTAEIGEMTILEAEIQEIVKILEDRGITMSPPHLKTIGRVRETMGEPLGEIGKKRLDGEQAVPKARLDASGMLLHLEEV
jgi:hypothetical protein